MIPKIIWSIFFVISAVTVSANWSPNLWQYNGARSVGKYALWLSYFAFVAYGLYATKHEDFFRALRKIGAYYWGKQIGIDLYIGFAFFLVFIGWHQGFYSALVWALPVLVYGNQLTLLYLAVHYEAIFTRLAASA